MMSSCMSTKASSTAAVTDLDVKEACAHYSSYVVGEGPVYVTRVQALVVVVVLHVCQAWVRLKVRVAVCAQEQQGSEHFAQEPRALALVDAQLASQL
eukprot:1887-Heterococcus_DN1.PRE.1